MERKRATIIFDDNDEVSSLSDKKEKTHAIRIRDSYYEKIRLIAFKQHRKMIDVLDDMLRQAINNEETSN